MSVLEKAPSAFVFPGQGSQSIGMGEELFSHSKAAREVLEEADMALSFPLSKLISRGPEDRLRDTVNAQPAIMTVSIAAWKAWQELAGSEAQEPAAVAGHSLGEYTSLVVSGVLSFEDGIRLVRERGRLMQQASQERAGGMAAIMGLGELALEHICAETGVELANVNAPGQIVISGEKVAIAWAIDLASKRGAKRAVPLKVAGAFHSELMRPALPGLKEAIGSLRFQDSQVPIVANCTGNLLTTAKEVKEELEQGLCRCVRWDESVRFMVNSGVSEFIEFGPPVLSGLIRRIDRSVRAVSLPDLSSIRSFVREHKKATVIGGVALAAGTIAGMKLRQHLRNRREKGRES